MSEFDNQSTMSWKDYLATMTPTLLFLEAEEIYDKYEAGEYYSDFAKDLLRDIDIELHKHGFWLPERLKFWK